MDKTLKKRKRMDDDEMKPNFFTRPEAEKIDLSIPEGAPEESDDDKSDKSNDDDEEDFPSERFRRGEDLPSDLDGDDSSKGSEEPIDPIDDGEWNMMGAALEREFLGLDDN